MSGLLERRNAANTDVTMLIRMSGGDWTETIAPIAIPAAMAVGAAAIGVTNVSSAIAWPNQVHRSPLTPR
jgi:hypothetical protein